MTPAPPPALPDPRAWRRCRARPALRDCAAVPGVALRSQPGQPRPCRWAIVGVEPGQGGFAARPGTPPPNPPRGRALLPSPPRPPCRLPPGFPRQETPSPAAAGRAVPGVPRRIPAGTFSLLLLRRRRLSSSCPARRNPAPRGARAAAAPCYWLARLSIKGGGARRPCCVTEHGGAPPSPPPTPHDPKAPIPSLSQAQPRAGASPTPLVGYKK